MSARIGEGVVLTLERVELCEPGRREYGTAAACDGPVDGNHVCGRIAFRVVGDYPWVECVCGNKFNLNYVAQIGEVPFEQPPGTRTARGN